ncbi:MAG TPA: hypothetical protein VF389_03645 [Woeseiaceae bacterium]
MTRDTATRQVNSAWLARELGFPVTDTVVLIAIVSFALLTTLAREAGIFGVWLGIILVPALYRYLLMLLEARALGITTPVAGIDVFNLVDNVWSLTPLVVLAVSIWGGYLLHHQVSPLAAWIFGVALFGVTPASLAILALTRSPFESLDPRAIARMIRACGPAYALVPAAMLLIGILVGLLGLTGLPAVMLMAGSYYAMFLMFTLTGALLHARDIQFSLTIPDPLQPADETLRERRVADRKAVLTHAYGFISRDNRAGGMAHVRKALGEESYSDDAWRWYFAEMLKWESKDAALMLGQDYLKQLLHEQRDVEAVKLMARCLLEDERFRPLPDDRDAARDVAKKLGRDDLVRNLDL